MGTELKIIMTVMRASKVITPYLRKVIKWLKRVKRKIRGGYRGSTIKIILFIVIALYLFLPGFNFSLLLDTWNQPAGFMQRIINMCVNLSKQIIGIFLGFNLKQYLLLFSWFIIRKII
ncbi:hypothetical protein [Lacrimispora amygdalina]|uniref:hypothetical protein n=1 Tax=Lacrimispora amygdalina TaxID=253257 RepID=UPI000BE2C799|nr:hypothetical protein [Lacrimispora amygdalina]